MPFIYSYPKRFIFAIGDLAAGLRGERCHLCMVFYEDHPEELAKCQALLVSFPGQHFLCGECYRKVRICLKPDSKTEYYVAHDSNFVSECDWLSRRPSGKLIYLESYDGEFFSLKDLGCTVGLRLRNFARHFVAGLVAALSGPGSKPGPQRDPRYELTLLGFLALLAEMALLSRWSPGRMYASRFPDLVPCLARCARDATADGFFPSFGEKLVFAGCEEDIANAIKSAAHAGNCAAKLDGQAVVVGRIRGLELVADDRVNIMLAGVGAISLSVKNDGKEGLWEAFTNSFGYPLTPNPAIGAQTMLIARVAPEGGVYRVVEVAWGRINRFGMLSMYRYSYEADTTEELITLGIPFRKGPVQRMKVGKRAMRVDFLVHVWDIDAKRARWIILEVDPNNSANEEKAKVERIKVSTRAGTTAVSYDPVRDKGLLEALRNARFEPLGTRFSEESDPPLSLLRAIGNAA